MHHKIRGLKPMGNTSNELRNITTNASQDEGSDRSEHDYQDG